MEESKYYTPKLEEFIEGLELWMLIYDEELDEYTKEWYRSHYHVSHGLGHDEIHQLHEGTIKVKYLDQQDIEELGFIYKGNNGMRHFYSGKEEWFNTTIPTGDSGRYWSFELIHDPKYNAVIVKAGTNYGEIDTFFEGTIKNKSELQKLLKQKLGIND